MADAVVPVAFDSDVYGRPWYRVRDPSAENALDACKSIVEDPDAVIDVKVPAEQTDCIDNFLQFGFRRIITQLSLRAMPRPDFEVDAQVEIGDRRQYGDDVVQAHAQNFVQSRYMRDPLLPRAKSIELMRCWIRNSLEGDAIPVIACGVNFCTFRRQGEVLQIDLISSLDKRRGMGRVLLSSLLAHAAQAGTTHVDVTTEAENFPAIKLYVTSGFEPAASEVCLHYVGNSAAPAER